MEQDSLYKTVYLENHCPQCGSTVEELDKNTSSGHDLRLYKCPACQWSDFIDVGISLWKAHSVASNQHHPESKPAISIAMAILVGQLVVNLPVAVVILAVAGIGIALTFVLTKLFPLLPDWTIVLGVIGSVMVGILVGWLWWSFSVPRWRKWALQKGAPEDKLQKWAVLTGLVWPKGSIFEKTEFKVKE